MVICIHGTKYTGGIHNQQIDLKFVDAVAANTDVGSNTGRNTPA